MEKRKLTEKQFDKLIDDIAIKAINLALHELEIETHDINQDEYTIYDALYALHKCIEKRSQEYIYNYEL